MEKTIITTKNLTTDICAEVCNVTGSSKSEVFLIFDERKVNAKSILGLISLSVKKGSKITVSARGKDEQGVIKAIHKII